MSKAFVLTQGDSPIGAYSTYAKAEEAKGVVVQAHVKAAGPLSNYESRRLLKHLSLLIYEFNIDDAAEL